MASWFKQRKSTGGEEPADSTVEVKAHVIADAVLSGPIEPQPEPVGVPSPEQGGEVLDQALTERRSLVALCLYAHDRARSSGVAERIEEGLRSVGVVALRPDGAVFDPALHEAGGTVGTEDAGLDGLVAETEVVGFADRGQVLRPPIVTVYTTRATQ